MTNIDRYILGLAAFLLGVSSAWAGTVTPLFERGYTVLPEPQRVELAGTDLRFAPEWAIERGPGVAPDDRAVRSLKEHLETRFGLRESRSSDRATVVRLSIRPASVEIGQALDRDRPILAQQAYRIQMGAGRIAIAANAPQGLFYGVQTLAQLLKRTPDGLRFPEGSITDWPDLQLRQIYWDDAHHLDRPEELRRAIRQAAFFKINAISIKLEGHFQFKSAPALVEPQALSPAELQELTDYGLKHYVQLIPYLDSPAHVAFILKHPEYAGLRAFPDNNYELCVVNPDSYRLLEGMIHDLVEANRGVRYFVLATDEPYYVGMADHAGCREKAAAEPLGSRGKLLAQFLTRIEQYLHDRGRTVLFWGEYPLVLNDISFLPSRLINGEVCGPALDAAYRARGIRQTIYTATQGEEPLFPEYFLLPSSRRLHSGGRTGPGRAAEVFNTVSGNPARKVADLMGMVVAAWGDSGLHPETFWLGYVSASAAGWRPNSPAPEELMSSFFTLFYGSRVTKMDRLYELLSTQAQFWADSWESKDSGARKPIWGNSQGVLKPPPPAHDQTLALPPRPSAGLHFPDGWREANEPRLRLAREFLAGNDELLALLEANLQRADFNRYNLEVLVTVGRLCRQNLEMLLELGRMESLLRDARAAASQVRPGEAVAILDQVLEAAERIRAERNRVLHDTTGTWMKSWRPRGGSFAGRTFLHELDDVKDHLPDRTTDMSYLVYRELLLPVGEWTEAVRSVRNDYAARHGLPLRAGGFDWRSLQ